MLSINNICLLEWLKKSGKNEQFWKETFRISNGYQIGQRESIGDFSDTSSILRLKKDTEDVIQDLKELGVRNIEIGRAHV